MMQRGQPTTEVASQNAIADNLRTNCGAREQSRPRTATDRNNHKHPFRATTPERLRSCSDLGQNQTATMFAIAFSGGEALLFPQRLHLVLNRPCN